MDNEPDMATVYKAMWPPEIKYKTGAGFTELLGRKWPFLQGGDDTAFPETACEIRDLTKSALRERTLSETFKKIRGPEGAAYKALLKSWTVHMPKWLWGGDLISICHQRYEASSIQVSEGCYQTEGGIGSVCLRNTDNQGLKWPKDTTKPNSRKRFLTMGSIFGKIRDYT